MINVKATGAKLKALRTSRHVSVYGLARIIGSSEVIIRKWECGMCLPSTDSMANLLKAFNVTFFDIIVDEGEKL